MITGSNFKVGIKYQILFICFAVLAIYYPTIRAEVCLLDDKKMIENLFNAINLSVKDIFFPRSTGGGYYRPLIALTFYADNLLWSLSPEIMHFENVLLHLLNCLLLFGICYQVSRHTQGTSWFPLLVTLIFAMHPANTESVNWISGRTDLLAGVFVLAAAFITLRFRQNLLVVVSAFLLVVVGALAKETSLAFLPGLFFLMLGIRAEKGAVESVVPRFFLVVAGGAIISLVSALLFYNYYAVILINLILLLALITKRYPLGSVKHIKIWSFFLLTLFLVCTIFWLYRRLAFTSDMSRIASGFTLIFLDPNATFHFLFGAAGFYVKKMVWPFPLNFTILEIDPAFSLLGIVVLVVSVYLIANPSIISGLILSSFCMLVPALPLSIAKIAWTPYAERYVYLALPFFAVAVALAVYPLAHKRLLFLLTGLLLIFFAWGTFDRSFVWQKNITLFADVVEKNPNFKPGRGLYMVALYNENLFKEATEQYYAAQLLPSVMYDEEFDLVMAGMLVEQKKYGEAESIYLKAYHKTKGKNSKVLKALISFYLLEYKNSTTAADKHKYKILVNKYLDEFSQNDYSPLALYNAAQTFLAIEERKPALEALRRAAGGIAPGDPLKSPVEKLKNSLEKE